MDELKFNTPSSEVKLFSYAVTLLLLFFVSLGGIMFDLEIGIYLAEACGLSEYWRWFCGLCWLPMFSLLGYLYFFLRQKKK